MLLCNVTEIDKEEILARYLSSGRTSACLMIARKRLADSVGMANKRLDEILAEAGGKDTKAAVQC